MRSVLIVFGVAIAILVVAIIFTPSKGLVDNPSEEAYKRQQEYDRQEQLENKKKQAAAQPAASEEALTKETIPAAIRVAGRGTIEVELYPKAAPKTVAHFVELAGRKFYDGILFHRVVPDFVVQAGDPASKSYSPKDIQAKDDGQGGTDGLGSGGSGPNGANASIPFESNPLKNETGTLAMALSGPRSDTGDSQFFINLKHNESLDGDYCVFGKVKSGMEVVNNLKRGDKIESITTK